MRSDPPTGPLLVELTVADSPVSWMAAGFRVEANRVQIGSVTLHLIGSEHDPAGGIVAWSVHGLTPTKGHIDGLPTVVASEVPPTDTDPPHHPNGAYKIDHVVVLTSDLERTVRAFEHAGLDLRRIREANSGISTVRQAFFRLGPTIVEVVSGYGAAPTHDQDGPAIWFGLVVDVADLDELALVLGDGLSRIRPAVQAGRRIATLRQIDFGFGTALAAMDSHADK